jgi:O-antigen ligase
MASPLVHLQGLLLLAVLLGGGGVAYGLSNLAIQLVALVLLAIHAGRLRQFAGEAPRSLQAVLFLTLAVPLLQLVPLPPAIWQALPGRELAVEAYALAGIPSDSWAPLSLDRARTLVAFTGLLAPVSVIVIGVTLGESEKRVLAWTLVALALVSFALGAVQLLSGNSAAMFYPNNAAADVLYATFANRNSTGLFFVCAAMLTLALLRSGDTRSLLAPAAIIVLLLVGTILTQSRSSMALWVLATLFLVARLGWSIVGKCRSGSLRGGLSVVLGGLAVVGLIAGSALMGGRAETSFARFAEFDQSRFEVWEDAAYAAGQYWPTGSGMGTFDEVFQIHESLEYVSPRKAGRAHNDYLEIAMEAGVAGLTLVMLWAVWVLLAMAGAVRSGPDWRRLGAGAVFGVIALQSTLDYPLRSQTMLCVAALMIVLLLPRRGVGA